MRLGLAALANLVLVRYDSRTVRPASTGPIPRWSLPTKCTPTSEGEKTEALCFILPVGLALLALAVTAIKAESGGFAWGVAIPCALFGLIFTATGIGVGARTAGQVAGIAQRYQDGPAALARAELERIQKVSRNFRLTFVVSGILTAIGLAIHYLAGPNLGRGLGAAIMLVSAIGLLVDGFAERRAEPYTDALKEETGSSHGGESPADSGED